MEATTEPVFPVLNRWLQSLHCTMFHSTWAGSFLHHKSDLKTLSPWARDLRSPERHFCPPRGLPWWQLLLSSDMDPVDHPAWQRCGPERKAKWMASKWTEERMAMHIIHSHVISTTLGKTYPKLSNHWGSQIMLYPFKSITQRSIQSLCNFWKSTSSMCSKHYCMW